ncbi:MAG: 3-hydroxyacyl-ACP dehydratase, partial [Nitrospirales bacterium]|nr:3-hydroxyacyl-ACP dehydratase [Nitrospirales bacterium]
MNLEKTFSVAGTHPALKDHFPGNPIVPGVVILTEILHIIRDLQETSGTWTGASCVKFHSPLHPEELVTVSLEYDDPREMNFRGQVEGRLVVSGTLTFQPKPGPA